MNDPQVIASEYRVEHAALTKYIDAPPTKLDAEDFELHLADGLARFELKKHFADVEQARLSLQPFIRSWEISAVLDNGPNEFRLRFHRAEVIDRAPSTGPATISGQGVLRAAHATIDAIVEIHRRKYPTVPTIPLDVDSWVEAMLHQYQLYQERKAGIAHVAYFCLTVLEKRAGGRNNAAAFYGIDRFVLATIGRLSSEKGGVDARKFEGIGNPLLPDEHNWLDQAIRLLVRRAAERVGTPTGFLPQLTMNNLPLL